MMKNMLNRLKKKQNKKGFTLVEIIVVLVILAILAAIAVPAVLGYVEDARKAQYVAEARSIYLVIQTEEVKFSSSFEDKSALTDQYLNTNLFVKLADKTQAGDYTVDNDKGEGIAAKNAGVKKVYHIVKMEDSNNNTVYFLRWISNNGKMIDASIHKNNKVYITSVRDS